MNPVPLSVWLRLYGAPRACERARKAGPGKCAATFAPGLGQATMARRGCPGPGMAQLFEHLSQGGQTPWRVGPNIFHPPNAPFRPMLATRPGGPSPPPQRHPARPRRRAERPDTRCGPETALTPPTHGATAPNLTDSALSRLVTTHPVRRPGARSRFLARKCAPR